MIKMFDLKNVPAGGYDFVKDGKVFAYGVRDSVEFTQDRYGNFWNVDNGADLIMRYNTPLGIGTDNPADEINFLGKVYPSRESSKAPNYGFPACHAVWNVRIRQDKSDRSPTDI